MKLAALADVPEITDFLRGHAATSMFPLSNLERHGMNGGHPRAVTFWVTRRAGDITDVLTITDEGMVMPQLCSGDYGAAAAILQGRAVLGFLGDGNQVAGLRQASGHAQKADLDTVEPCYALRLDDLVMPDCERYDLRPLDAVSIDTLIVWRAAYCEESLATPPGDSVEKGEADIAAYKAADSHRVLFHQGEPVAMTGFNATTPGIVQIGGVYTPPKLRARGYARRALALHLTQVADTVTDAVLFAANPPAERAYRALGFRRQGTFAIAIYADPKVTHG